MGRTRSSSASSSGGTRRRWRRHVPCSEQPSACSIRATRPCLRLVAATGARRGEVAALRWSDVDWERSTVRLDEAVAAAEGVAQLETSKTRSSRRRVAADAATLGALRRLQAEQGRLASLCELVIGEDAFVFSAEALRARPRPSVSSPTGEPRTGTSRRALRCCGFGRARTCRRPYSPPIAGIGSALARSASLSFHHCAPQSMTARLSVAFSSLITHRR